MDDSPGMDQPIRIPTPDECASWFQPYPNHVREPMGYTRDLHYPQPPTESGKPPVEPKRCPRCGYVLNGLCRRPKFACVRRLAIQQLLKHQHFSADETDTGPMLTEAQRARANEILERRLKGRGKRGKKCPGQVSE
jgi:hypothetical protein